MAFNKPASSNGFAPSQHPEWQGRLFLIYPLTREEVQFPDKQPGELTTVITADVAIVDLPDPLTGDPFTKLFNVSITSKALIPQLAKYVGTGTAALGRLNARPPQPGKNPAYALDDDYTDADAALATPVDASSAQWRGRFGQANTPPPAAQAPAPVPTPVPAPVSQPAAGPWYADPANAQLVAQLAAKGVPFTMLPDQATAQLAAQG